MTYERAFGRAVRQRRENLGWNQSELARRAQDGGLKHFKSHTVHRVETATRPLRLDEAIVLSRILGGDLQAMVSAETVAEACRRELLNNLNALDRLGTAVAQVRGLVRFANEATEALTGVPAALDSAVELSTGPEEAPDELIAPVLKQRRALAFAHEELAESLTQALPRLEALVLTAWEGLGRPDRSRSEDA